MQFFFSFLHTWALIWWDKKEKFLKAHPVISHCGNARISCQACYTNFIEKVWNIRNPNMPEIRQCVTFSLFEFTFFSICGLYYVLYRYFGKRECIFKREPLFWPSKTISRKEKTTFFFKRLLLAKIGGPTFPKLLSDWVGQYIIYFVQFSQGFKRWKVHHDMYHCAPRLPSSAEILNIGHQNPSCSEHPYSQK